MTMLNMSKNNMSLKVISAQGFWFMYFHWYFVEKWNLCHQQYVSGRGSIWHTHWCLSLPELGWPPVNLTLLFVSEPIVLLCSFLLKVHKEKQQTTQQHSAFQDLNNNNDAKLNLYVGSCCWNAVKIFLWWTDHAFITWWEWFEKPDCFFRLSGYSMSLYRGWTIHYSESEYRKINGLAYEVRDKRDVCTHKN